ncbi:Nucleoside diphosphate kinase 1 [Trifolium repens]|nr:Nucleoside diphosphate kinase 1 [Trifolium repens]
MLKTWQVKTSIPSYVVNPIGRFRRTTTHKLFSNNPNSRFEKKGFYLKGLKFLNVERTFAEKHYDYSRNNQLAQCPIGADLHGAFILGE